MPRKLIEVALPLEAINKEASREKSIRHGHPSTLHLWWARRPLAACRAVLFAQLVDDPGSYMPDEESAAVERQRLFRLIEQLVKWENINDEELLNRARLEIARSIAREMGVDAPIGEAAMREFLAEKAPPLLDPFAGGGSIPLEAQRLGLRAYASDLNPVAVLINKALIEIPPKFANLPPAYRPHGQVEEPSQTSLFRHQWRGAQGLAEDVRAYGQWMRDQAEKRIGHLYPKVTLTEEILAARPDLRAEGYRPGEALTVIAWLWARTVRCPNPACGAQMPLARSFWLSKKKNRKAWVVPHPIRSGRGVRVSFTVETGDGGPPDGTVNRRGAHCIACGTPVPLNYVRHEGQAGRMGTQLMAIVAEGRRGRVYFAPLPAHEAMARQAQPRWKPTEELQGKLRVSVPLYGMNVFADLFTPRQLVALTTFSDLVGEARARVEADALAAGWPAARARAYADAVATYLAFAVSRYCNRSSTICIWNTIGEKIEQTFGRQAIPMTWDFAEANPVGHSTGSWDSAVLWIPKVLELLPGDPNGHSQQADAQNPAGANSVVATDPPYYDNISYADLSDFFYVWLRRALGDIYPDLFATLLVPKAQELVATPNRFGGDRQEARRFFETGLQKAFANLRRSAHPAYPLTVYYAFKQSERDAQGQASTGWETMLAGLMASGFQITGTWPLRTERDQGLKTGTNVLASSIVLVCRPRPEDAPRATRREFLAALRRELPTALRRLQQGSIAPVDLAQAAIGPGMAIFSRYRQVLEADGSAMAVRSALALINQVLDEFLTEQEGEYDAATRWALAWFEQYGHEEGPYGAAETLSKAKNTSVEGLARIGILEARAGKVRLRRRAEIFPASTQEGGEGRSAHGGRAQVPLTAWEAVQHLIQVLDTGGERAAADLLAQLGPTGEAARDLAYRLYVICERKGWTQDALGYNMLAVAWLRLRELAQEQERQQGRLI